MDWAIVVAALVGFALVVPDSQCANDSSVQLSEIGNRSKYHEQVEFINRFLLSSMNISDDNNTNPNEIQVIPVPSVVDELPVQPRVPRRSEERRRSRNKHRHSTRVYPDQPVRILLPPSENQIPAFKKTVQPLSENPIVVISTSENPSKASTEIHRFEVTKLEEPTTQSVVGSGPQHRRVFIPPPLRYLLPPFFYENYISAQQTTRVPASTEYSNKTETSTRLAPIIVIETVSEPDNLRDWDQEVYFSVETTTAYPQSVQNIQSSTSNYNQVIQNIQSSTPNYNQVIQNIQSPTPNYNRNVQNIQSIPNYNHVQNVQSSTSDFNQVIQNIQSSTSNYNQVIKNTQSSTPNYNYDVQNIQSRPNYNHVQNVQSSTPNYNQIVENIQSSTPNYNQVIQNIQSSTPNYNHIVRNSDDIRLANTTNYDYETVGAGEYYPSTEKFVDDRDYSWPVTDRYNQKIYKHSQNTESSTQPARSTTTYPFLTGPNIEQTLFETGQFFNFNTSKNSSQDTVAMMNRPLLSQEVAKAGMKITANLKEEIREDKLSRGKLKYNHFKQFKFQNDDDDTLKLQVAESSYYDGNRRPTQKAQTVDDQQQFDIQAIPGNPGRDYPTLNKPPSASGFSCHSVNYHRGYVADPSTGCQVFYICVGNGPGEPMLCPNGTLFSQDFLVCDWWYNVDCQPLAPT